MEWPSCHGATHHLAGIDRVAILTGVASVNMRSIVTRARAPRQVPKLALGGQRVPPPVTPLPLSAVESSSLFNRAEGWAEG